MFSPQSTHYIRLKISLLVPIWYIESQFCSQGNPGQSKSYKLPQVRKPVSPRRPAEQAHSLFFSYSDVYVELVILAAAGKDLCNVFLGGISDVGERYFLLTFLSPEMR